MRAGFLIALCLSVLPAVLSVAAVSDEDIIARIVQSGAEITSMDCNFTQTRHSGLLDGDIVTKGRMCYKKPDRLRWEYSGSMPFAFILNGSKFIVDGNGQNGGTGGQNKMMKEIARLILNTISGNTLIDGKTFQTSVDASENNWIVTLVPIRKDMKQMWSRIVLTFDYNRNSVIGVGMYETGGDYTVIEFNDINRNVVVDDSLFGID